VKIKQVQALMINVNIVNVMKHDVM